MSLTENVKIISRDSFLALAQTIQISDRLAELGIKVSISARKTSGDIQLSDPLYATPQGKEGKAFFTRELEDALLRGEADLAVHSLKDLPTVLPDGLELVGMAFPEDRADVLVSRQPLETEQEILRIPETYRFASSSLRRMALLQFHFPGRAVLAMRGNVITRLEKLCRLHAKTEEHDGQVLALAGLQRLFRFHRYWREHHGRWRETLGDELSAHLEEQCRRIEAIQQQKLHYYRLEPSDFPPAAAQAVLGLEAKKGFTLPTGMKDREDWRYRVRKEREILATLEAGCHLPLGMDLHSIDRQTSARIFFSPDYDGSRRDFTVLHLHRSLEPRDALSMVRRELKQQLTDLVFCGRNENFSSLFESAHLKIHHLPLIETVAAEVAENVPALRADVAVYASAAAVDVVAPLGFPQAQAHLAVGSHTLAALARAGVAAEAAGEPDSEGAARSALSRGIRTAIWFGAKDGVRNGIELLQKNGVAVTEIATHKSLPKMVSPEHPALHLKEESLWVFTSPSVVHSYFEQGLVQKGHYYSCLGGTTAAALTEYGADVYHVASRSELSVLASELQLRPTVAGIRCRSVHPEARNEEVNHEA